MKSLILTLAVLAIVLASSENVCSADSDRKSVFLCVILDSRPNSDTQWNILRALLLKGVHSLEQGDKLEILVARPGDPYTKVNVVLGPPDGSERDRIIEVVSGLNKEFLFGADLAKAMKCAFDSLRENDQGYLCCLMVLTDGRIDYRQAEHVLRMNSVFRTRGWPVCITCDGKEASRQLLAAGNRRDIDLRFIDRPFLHQWLSSVRSTGASDVLVPADNPEIDSQEVGEGKASAGEVINSAPEPAVVQDAISDISAIEEMDLVNVRIVDMPSLDGGIHDDTRKIGEANNVSLEGVDAKEDFQQSRPDKKQRRDDTGKTAVRRTLPMLAVAAGGVLGAGLLTALVLVLKDSNSLRKSRGSLTMGDVLSQPDASRIVAYLGDQRQDLGDADMVTEITVGKGLGSTVYIDNDALRDTHLRIFKARKALKAQNLADAPVTINGTQLRPRAKMDLAMPADIELVPGLSITLLTEPVEVDTETDSNEDQA